MQLVAPHLVIAGGSGYLGHALSQHFAAQYEIIVLTRHIRRDSDNIRFVPWNARTPGAWCKYLQGASAVINLAGRSVNCRYNAANRREIYASRLNATRAIGEAIAATQNPPKLWLNASSATIYRDARDRDMDEFSGEIGTGFSVDVCQKWEQVLALAATPHTRKIALRMAMVMGHEKGGVLEVFSRLARLGLGGPHGDGGQYMSWIHLRDFCRAIEFLMSHEELSGEINLSSPNPLPEREFQKQLREVLGVSFGLPTPRPLLEIGARLIGTETELLLKSRRVVPTRLLQAGFTFEFPHWREAAEELLKAEKPN